VVVRLTINSRPSVSTAIWRSRPTICRVEDRRGGITPFSVAAHQTGRADFPRIRLSDWLHRKAHGEDDSGELVSSTPMHFVCLTQEVPRSVIDMLIEGLV
jgi:hypothetical protein